ncbi:MAG: type II secretion system protein [Bacilli bacterium]|nr:type II secretion system protein [Bacilli bacterium]
MKKGFTLIELLAVIIILGVLLAIIVPSVQRSIDASKTKLYAITVKELEKGAKAYVLKYGSTMTSLVNEGVGFVTIQQLVDEGIIETPVNNPLTGDEFAYTESVKIIKDSESNYTIDFLETSFVSLISKFATNVGSNGVYSLAKNGADYFAGSDPNNWIEFGQVSSGDTTPLMWRIIKNDTYGIRLVYEGVKNGTSAPTADGIALTQRWDGLGTNSNKWESSTTLKPDLATWYTNFYATNKTTAVNPINWCIGGAYNSTATTLTIIKAQECISQTTGSGTFLGTTTVKTPVGLMLASDFMSTTTSATCTAVSQTDCSTNNFLAKNYSYATATANANSTSSVWTFFENSGSGYIGGYDASYSIAVRLLINIKTSSEYDSGNGTLATPYKIK